MQTRTDVFVKTGMFTLAVIAVAALLIAVGAKAVGRAAREASLGHYSDYEGMDWRSGGAFHPRRWQTRHC
jgi:hypothetical protein